MAALTLSFENGTVRVAGADEARVADLPGVEWDPRSQTGRAPAHRYGALRDALDEVGVPYEDRVLDLPALDLRSTYELREYQREAYDAWRDAGDRGVLELPTGSGKTVVAIAAVERLGTPTLVVVPTIDLLDQWRRELETEFGDALEFSVAVGLSMFLAILAASGFEQSELFQPLEALRRAGATVEVVSLKSGRITGWDQDNWGESMRVMDVRPSLPNSCGVRRGPPPRRRGLPRHRAPAAGAGPDGADRDVRAPGRRPRGRRRPRRPTPARASDPRVRAVPRRRRRRSSREIAHSPVVTETV